MGEEYLLEDLEEEKNLSREESSKKIYYLAPASAIPSGYLYQLDACQDPSQRKAPGAVKQASEGQCFLNHYISLHLK